MITNTGIISPMPVIIGAAKYPEHIIEKLESLCNLISLDAGSLATEVGEPRAVNMVLMGVLAKDLALDEQLWLTAIEKSVPERFMPTNRKAFAVGYKAV